MASCPYEPESAWLAQFGPLSWPKDSASRIHFPHFEVRVNLITAFGFTKLSSKTVIGQGANIVDDSWSSASPMSTCTKLAANAPTYCSP
ncbi:hypothetical protein VNO77_39430 [Canavalia gladiata]|uniref:Uncharacterized protein n=1 Tax=Canavalia gladiata TaxID=3824 RepID=A0AAN9KB34_CANGL